MPIFVRRKVFGSASCFSGNLATRESKPRASATIAKHVYARNNNTERAKRTARRDSPQSRRQTQQRDVRSLPDLAGFELACEA